MTGATSGGLKLQYIAMLPFLVISQKPYKFKTANDDNISHCTSKAASTRCLSEVFIAPHGMQKLHALRVGYIQRMFVFSEILTYRSFMKQEFDAKPINQSVNH